MLLGLQTFSNFTCFRAQVNRKATSFVSCRSFCSTSPTLDPSFERSLDRAFFSSLIVGYSIYLIKELYKVKRDWPEFETKVEEHQRRRRKAIYYASQPRSYSSLVMDANEN